MADQSVEEKFKHYVEIVGNISVKLMDMSNNGVETVKIAAFLTFIDVLDNRLGGRMV